VHLLLVGQQPLSPRGDVSVTSHGLLLYVSKRGASEDEGESLLGGSGDAGQELEGLRCLIR
jgi:hypothetical protein